MADQNITELPVKTSSGMTSSDYMLGIDSAEGYQMLIKDLGDYIIRNVQVNTIAGANQTLKSALDTLNSKTSVAGSITYNGLTFSMFANSLTASLKIRGRVTTEITIPEWVTIGSVGNFGLREDFYTKVIANNRTSIILLHVLPAGTIYISGTIPVGTYVENDIPIML